MRRCRQDRLNQVSSEDVSAIDSKMRSASETKTIAFSGRASGSLLSIRKIKSLSFESNFGTATIGRR
ncbi:MAG: hypothetical protein P1V97_24375, partial [Planctomycetota bacterium]|nr:hypothetical protein [Planctomycetota bacterium]